MAETTTVRAQLSLLRDWTHGCFRLGDIHCVTADDHNDRGQELQAVGFLAGTILCFELGRCSGVRNAMPRT